ncbi:hypothetical protein AMAG_08041 [Allomyces macrogynus ATCC 38327]|uniref:Uncharacterized protein n=1 Tax=Allomyces macrogynus (strain ATCC 38327) TaxID=578462 RepID=A0A0L0SKC3_ALLM3|nr:hypothetical protein AMAG_08041 [Allomyces macrogynus ATCC 38327]|eukprot:KNE62864.1 hypothetical protein AMAG_08041 [Allomyces macrogynus ATCC 38327]
MSVQVDSTLNPSTPSPAASRGTGPTFKLPARHAAVLAAKASASASTHASFRGGKSLRVAPAATARPPSAQTAAAMARTAPAARHQHAPSPLQPRRVPSAGLSRSRAVPGGSASSSSLPLPRADRSDASLVDAPRVPVASGSAATAGSQPFASRPAQRYLKKRAPAGKVQGAGWTSTSTTTAPRAGARPAAALARCASSPDLGTSPPAHTVPALTAARDSGVQLSAESVSADTTKHVVPAPWAAALTLSTLPSLPGTTPAPAPRMHLARPLLYLHHLQIMWGVDDDAVDPEDADPAVERATRANAFTLRFKIGDDDADVERRAARRAARKVEHLAGAWTVRFHDAVACVLFDPNEQVRGAFGAGGGRRMDAATEDAPCPDFESVQAVPAPLPAADAACGEADEPAPTVVDQLPVPDACLDRADADLAPVEPALQDEPIPTVVTGTRAQTPPAPTADACAAVLAAPQAGELDWVVLDGVAEEAAAAAVEPMAEDTPSEAALAKPVAKGPVRRLLCRLVASIGIDVCSPSTSAAAAVADGADRTARAMP